jgi:hypothetical protein
MGADGAAASWLSFAFAICAANFVGGALRTSVPSKLACALALLLVPAAPALPAVLRPDLWAAPFHVTAALLSWLLLLGAAALRVAAKPA